MYLYEIEFIFRDNELSNTKQTFFNIVANDFLEALNKFKKDHIINDIISAKRRHYISII